MVARVGLVVAIGLMGCSSDSGEGVLDASLADGGTADSGVATDAGPVDVGADASAEIDAGADAGLDASAEPDAGCSVGEVMSEATASGPALFGSPVPVAEGADLSAGTYRVRYTDGCFKFASDQGWTVHARLDGNFTWWLVDGATSERLEILPGTVGITPGAGAFAEFDDCVAANLLEPELVYEHDGGPLSVLLTDSNFSDNVAGVDGRNPAWEFIYDDCAP
jgi:hypothetical protein